MSQTYQSIQQEIERLKMEADRLRSEEVDGVVDRIKEAIATYGLTEADLFGRGGTGKARSPRSGQAAYSDGNGNVWGGRGPRPLWLRQALARGKQLQEFAVGARPSPVSPPRKAAAKKRAGRGIVAVKYRDGEGNHWSGRGTRPRWLAAAVAAGKKVEDFAV